MSIQFVDELPASPDRNTQYYVETETTGVWNIYISDNLGVVRAAGTTELDMDSYVRSTTKVAGVKLEADVSAQQIEDATKSLSATLTNKSIDASDNTISNIATPNMASSAIATSIGDSPVDTKLATEKSIYDYAVPKVSTASQVYGSSSNYTLATSISNASTAAQIPTAKSIYDYAVPKTSDSNKVYGSSTNYTASDTYTSTASNQLLTRAGAYNLYNAYCAVSSGTVTLASGWTGSIKWVRSGKVVTMYGEMSRTGSGIGSWAFTTLASTLPTELRPKVQCLCNGFSDYTANVTAVNKGYVNNEIVITTAGIIQVNPRNSIGIPTGDFLYWHITYITA